MNTPLSALLERKGNAVYSVSPDASVAEAVRTMNEHRIGCVLVIENHHMVGIFTERDVLARVVLAELPAASTSVREVMTPRAFSLTPHASLAEAMELFNRQRCRHLPVEVRGEVVGLVSIGDISRWISESYAVEAAHLRSYVAGGY